VKKQHSESEAPLKKPGVDVDGDLLNYRPDELTSVVKSRIGSIQMQAPFAPPTSYSSHTGQDSSRANSNPHAALDAFYPPNDLPPSDLPPSFATESYPRDLPPSLPPDFSLSDDSHSYSQPFDLPPSYSPSLPSFPDTPDLPSDLPPLATGTPKGRSLPQPSAGYASRFFFFFFFFFLFLALSVVLQNAYD
jgi:hypothetical protein